MPFTPRLLPGRLVSACRKTIIPFNALIFFLLSGYIVSAQTQVQRNDYRVQYSTADRIFGARYFYNTRDGGTIITGKKGYSDDSSKLFVMKIDRYGNALWTKYLSNQPIFREYNVCETADGSIVFAGNSYLSPPPLNKNIYLYKFTCGGQLVWSKVLTIPGLSNRAYPRPNSLREGKNQDVILSVSNNYYNADNQFALVCRINQAGDLIWSKSFQGYDPNSIEFANSSFYLNDKIIVLGMKRISINYVDYQRRLFAMRLNYETGNMEYINGFGYTEFPYTFSSVDAESKVHFDAVQLSGNRFSIFGMFNYGSSTPQAYFFKMTLGPDLSLNSSLGYAFNSAADGARKITVFPNGETHITAEFNDETYTHPNIYWYSADSNDVEKKSIIFGAGYEVFASAFNVSQNGESGSNWAVGLASNSIQKIVVQAASFESDNAAMRACLQARDTSLIKLVYFSPGYQSWSWNSVTSGTAVLNPAGAVAEDVQPTAVFLCKGANYQPPGLSCNAALPVKLVSFTGETVASGNLLQWTMEEDGDGGKYVLQSSEDGINFSDVFSQHMSQSRGKFTYACFDKRSYHLPVVQYRVQTTLPDGSQTYSQIIMLRRSAAAESFSLYPNPVQGTVSIAGDSRPDKAEWFTVSGVRVKSITSPAIGQAINVTDLAKGVYLVRIYQGGSVFTTKMIRN